MATVDDWQKYINLLHELAFVEDDLRRIVNTTTIFDEQEGQRQLAANLLWERFGVDNY